MVAAAVIAGGAVVGGAISAKGAKSAAKTGAGSEQAGIDYQRESRDLSLAYNKPARDAGYQALAALMDMSGLTRPAPTDPDATPEPETITQTFRGRGNRGVTVTTPGSPVSADAPNMGDFGAYDWTKNNPGYDFRFEEGQRATENLLSKAGMLNSGKGMRVMTRYGQDYASNEFSNAWGRLSQIAGFGNAAVSGGNQVIGNSANAVQQGYSNIGGANAYGKIGEANAWGGAITDIAGTVGDWYGKQTPTTIPQNTGSVGGGGYRYGP